MTAAREHLAADPSSKTDRLNRGIAQEAFTDQELESQVPPVSKSGTGWRIAVGVALIVALLTAIILIS